MKMKKLLSVILAAVMLLGCMSIPAFAADPQVLEGFSGGDGSADSPYQIGTKAQLEHLAEIVNGGNTCADTYFELTDNIGSTETPVTTVIGGERKQFNGHFDGNGFTVTLNITGKSPDEIKLELNDLDVQLDDHTIKKISMMPDMAEMLLGDLPASVTMEQVMAIIGQGLKGDAGLFSQLGEGGEIQNVTTAGSVNGKGNVSGVCAINYGTIMGCINNAEVSSTTFTAGGVCGGNYGTVTNCLNTGKVSAKVNVAGGVCGDNSATITNCCNDGEVSGESFIGGVCGSNNYVATTITNCFNTAKVIGTGMNIGGVCGSNEATITNCYYNSTVYSGNVCGYGDQGTASYGLPTAQCKGAAGTPDALVDKLNGYTDTETGKYPEDWKTWVIGADGYPTFESEPENDFLTSFTLNKDYNDKYITDAKTTKVNETVTFTITPITANAPEFETDTFTITVTNGIGSADVDLPGTDDIDSVGDYWYKIEETEGTTAGVDYDDTTYYLHLIVSYKDGEFGFSSAVVRSSNDVTATDGEYPTTGKIDTVSNTYGEGTLTVGQVTTVNGEDSSEDTFTAEVTFTAPTGTTVTGEIKYGDLTIDPEDWDNGSVTVEIELKGGDTVLFENIPDGVTYTVEQTESNEDKGYTLDSVEFDVTDETGDTVSDAMIASGTVSDAADTVTITNSKTVPIDVGVILENGAFIVLALGAIAAAAWLIISKRRKSVDAE